MPTEELPKIPFATKDFAPKGGGLDFLGLRVVNLRILARDLLPGINNATSDVGMFMLGTWLPWKFEQLANQRTFNTSNFDRFNEAVQIAMSHVQRDGSPAEEKYGAARRRVGVDQKVAFPTELRFEKVGRTSATSIFAAPLYGPALRSLSLHRGFARGENGRNSSINLADDGPDAVALAEHVDKRLEHAKAYEKLVRLDPAQVTSAQIDELGVSGLHPASYRSMPTRMKRIFAGRLLPTPKPGIEAGRTMTAALLHATLRQKSGLNSEQVLRAWHTGFIGAKPLRITDPILDRHRQLWSLFMARQFQRFCLEYFMHCFEQCLADKLRTISACATALAKEIGTEPSFRAVCVAEAKAIGTTGEMVALSKQWNQRVNGQSPNYDWGDDLDDDRPEESAIRMLARWHLRTFGLIEEWKGLEQLDWDGPERVSIRWFSGWLEQKADLPLAQFLEELLTQFVFTQHLRVAMGRFAGSRDVQRLRFCLDDSGIVRTAAVEHEEPLEPSWMADRFDAFVALLCDLDIIHQTDGKLSLGPLEELVPHLGPAKS